MIVPKLDPSSKDPLSRDISTLRRLGLRWKNLHFLWKMLTVIAVMAVLALPFYGKARKVLRSWKYENDLIAAKTALAAGRDAEARDLALSVLRGSPEKTEALPIFMRAAEGTADSRLVGAARGVLSLKSADQADRLFAWQAICQQSPMGITARTWFTLREDEREDPDFVSHWLERLVTEGLNQEVEKELSIRPKLADPRVERIRLSALAKRGTDVAFHELQARLLDRLASHPQDGPLLLGVMEEIPQSALIPYAFTGLGDWLKTRSGEPSVEDQLRLARCEMAAQPETADAVMSRVTAAHAARDPLAVARLHFTLKQFDKAEKLLEPLVNKGDSGAFQLMAEVQERLGNLEKWDKLLETPPSDVFLPNVLSDRAFIAAKRGDERAQPKFEQDAVAAAELRMKGDSLVLLARHASKREMNVFATDVWVKAIRKGPASPLPLFSVIGPVIDRIARNQNEAELMDVLSVYHAIEPENPGVATQYLYLGCLLGRVTPASVVTELSPLQEKIPSLPIDCTLAFANVLEGHPEKAAKLTEDDQIDWFAQIPAFRAIRAIVLAKTGRREEADIYLEDFPWDALLPGETRVFRELLDESGETEEPDDASKAEKSAKAREAEEARQAAKAKELTEVKAALQAKEAGKSEETRNAEKAERAERIEKARLALQSRQEQREREAKAAREAKEAEARAAAESTPDSPP